MNIEIKSAAVIYGLTGLLLIFGPDEVTRFVGENPSSLSTWALQCLGAAYVAIAWMNFLNKHAVLGGIYGRPVLLMNVMFASPSFFFSLDLMQLHPEKPLYVGVTIVFGLLTAGFLRRLLGKGPTLEQPAS